MKGSEKLNKDFNYTCQPVSIELSYKEWQQVIIALRYRRKLLKKMSKTQNSDLYIEEIISTRLALRKIAICCDEMYSEWYGMFHGTRKFLFSINCERGENFQDAVKQWLDKTADISWGYLKHGDIYVCLKDGYKYMLNCESGGRVFAYRLREDLENSYFS